ncbi:hypothetical protein R3Q06_32090 [Rhodococcus erythropolis]|uniref:hypothetical protein n=1 Tax=Rhodococcus erythropolis TaxID=1833 RepID=UPI0029490956|nr:hypothetical protein [Rhodococcus erythropolis]MDV6278116.1 hypothetical protein [Rhodococcus erythropolis]
MLRTMFNVWLYRRFTFSFRETELLMAARGIEVFLRDDPHLVRTFGPEYARRLPPRHADLTRRVMSCCIPTNLTTHLARTRSSRSVAKGNLNQTVILTLERIGSPVSHERGGTAPNKARK